MAQYHGGQYYYQQPNDHHHQQHHPAPPAQYPTTYPQTDEYGNPLQEQATAGASPAHDGMYSQTSGSGRYQDGGVATDFMNHGQRPSVLPAPSNSSSYSTAQSPRYQYNGLVTQRQSYNPQGFWSQQQPSASSPHAPYNPADYHDDSIQRMGSQRGSYSPGSYGMSSPTFSPHMPQTPNFHSPPMSQPPAFSTSRSSLYGPPRSAALQTSAYQMEQNLPPQPPRLPQYTAHQDPLHTIPQSANEAEDDWNNIPSQQHSPVLSFEQQQKQYYRGNSDPATPDLHHSPSTSRNHRHSLSHGSRLGANDNRQSPAPSYTSITSHPLPPTPSAPAPPSHSSSRRPSDRSTVQREDYFDANDPYIEEGHLSSEDLMNEVEQEIMNFGMGSNSRHTNGTPGVYRSGSHTNGHLSPDAAYDDYINSDPEADAGVEAMRVEEEGAEAARRSSNGSGNYSYQSQQHVEHGMYNDNDSGTESDGPPVDLSLFGGGFDVQMSYGGDPESLTLARHSSLSRGDSRSYAASSNGSMRRSHASDADLYGYENNMHRYPPFTNVRVDAGGTGGFEDPTEHNRRLSYDEGDESAFLDEHGTLRDNYYYPDMSNTRPLPQRPPGEPPSYPTSTSSTPYPADSEAGSRSVSFPRMPPYPQAPDHYIPASAASPNVPRSTSLLSHSTTPQQVHIMPRSRTDAEERKWKQQTRKSVYLGADSDSTPVSACAGTLDLPNLPTAKRYNPAKLGTGDFKKCAEPWAISAVVSWLKSMAEGEQDLKEQMLIDGLVALFTNKVPTMNTTDAETLAARLVTKMREVGALVQEEEWLKFGPQTMTGVIYQLTGTGCYSPMLHNHNVPGRCYSHHCQRTLKKLDLSSVTISKGVSEDWATFYKIKAESLSGVDKKEIARQNILHEIVWKEEKFMEDLDVLRRLYRDGIQYAHPALITPSRLPSFVKDVFGGADAVKKANEDYLLPQLKYRQSEQGPWITGFSDIFREWIRKAKTAYTLYASAFPAANYRIRNEAEKNAMFSKFLDNTRALSQSRKLGWDTYLKVPITKLQQYGLLLTSVLKETRDRDVDEKRNLELAIKEIKDMTHECDARVAECSRQVKFRDLQLKLRPRDGMPTVDLNLDHLGRELIYEGDLQRMSQSKFNWMEEHALLFDHYFVMAKYIRVKDMDNSFREYYQYQLPIPMDLLVLGSRDDETVSKSKTGIAAVASVSKTTGAHESSSSRSNRASSNQTDRPVPAAIQHSNTQTSQSSTATTTVLEGGKDDKVMYPFRVKHLGKGTYTLFAPTYENREAWCNCIVAAKTRHARALFRQNMEPFRIRVMADCAFAYENGSGPSTVKSTLIKDTPLERAIREVDERYKNAGRPTAVCRARVNCGTNFRQLDGREMCAVGTDDGVFVSSLDDPRGWHRVTASAKIGQIAVLEEFELLLVIADKSLIAHHLDIVCSVGGGPSNSADVRGAPQKLSGSRDVGFFATGKMKDRMLVFYKKKEGLSSTFKVLEPVFQKSTEKKSRFAALRSGRTEFFREYDEFYIPTECMGLNLFHSSLAVSTLKGFEVLTLDKKQPSTVPDLKQPAVASIAGRLQGQKPLGMFRLGEHEFLCVYEQCAVYMNSHGDISQGMVMEFVGKARSATLFGAYVLLFDPDFVEIRNVQDGRLRQVIAGRDVRCIDDGMNWNGAGGEAGRRRRIKLAMQHPRAERQQLVLELELVLNGGLEE